MPQFERAPAVDRKISSIDPKKDKRVKLLATLVAKEPENGFVALDDGSGKVNALFSEAAILDKLKEYKEGTSVLVVGTVIVAPNGFDINGEVLRAAEPGDVALKEKVNKLWNDEFHDF